MSPEVLSLLLHWPISLLGSPKSPDPSLVSVLAHLEMEPLSLLFTLWGQEGHLGWEQWLCLLPRHTASQSQQAPLS